MSISTSKINSDIILEIKNFSASYAVPFHRSYSLRDAFIRIIKSPVNFLKSDLNRIVLFQKLNLQLKRGDRLAIIGNNGCGKTTLCRYIAGLYGRRNNMTINGNIRSIFDTETAVIPELSGRENVELLAHLFYPGVSKEEKAEIIKDAIEFSDIGQFIDAPFLLYSKGMRARLCLSIISARATDLLILDEVFNGADHFFSEKISKRITDLILKSGAVIFISHSLDTVVDVCNRAIVLDDKRIAFDGTPKEAVEFYLANCHKTKITNFE